MHIATSLILVVFFYTTLLLSTDAASLQTWNLYHSIPSLQVREQRGTITLNEDGSLQVSNHNDKNSPVVSALGHGMLYQLQLESAEDRVLATTSVPACQVLRANFRYVIYYVYAYARDCCCSEYSFAYNQLF
jgi:hypothetical protein